MKRTATGLVAVFVALVVAGFILAGYWDATGSALIPGYDAFKALPRAARIAIEVAIGVPLAFGAALYFITQLAEFLWLVSWPFRKVVALLRRASA